MSENKNIVGQLAPNEKDIIRRHREAVENNSFINNAMLGLELMKRQLAVSPPVLVVNEEQFKAFNKIGIRCEMVISKALDFPKV